jgi:hypothetical protein
MLSAEHRSPFEWHVLDVRHPRHLAILVAEDLLRVVAVSVGTVVERARAVASIGKMAPPFSATYVVHPAMPQ